MAVRGTASRGRRSPPRGPKAVGSRRSGRAGEPPAGVGKPGRCPASPAASLLPARWPDGSPARPARRLPKAVGRRPAWLAMPRIAAPGAPGRKPWEAVSMGHYQRDLVLAPDPPPFTAHDWPGRGFSSVIVARLYFLRPGGPECARPSAQQSARDDVALDLRRSLVDLEDPQVADVALQRHRAGVTIAAVDL